MGKLKNLKKLEKFLLCKRQSRAKAIYIKWQSNII
jgi:hypothetical protein